jgi:hypothetical protein
MRNPIHTPLIQVNEHSLPDGTSSIEVVPLGEYAQFKVAHPLMRAGREATITTLLLAIIARVADRFVATGMSLPLRHKHPGGTGQLIDRCAGMVLALDGVSGTLSLDECNDLLRTSFPMLYYLAGVQGDAARSELRVQRFRWLEQMVELVRARLKTSGPTCAKCHYPQPCAACAAAPAAAA